MYAVGHFALGYLIGRITSKTLNIKINLHLLFLASILPDVDIIMPGLMHRGPLHSIILFSILFTPIFLTYKKSVIPYFFAVIQHILIGDYLTGGIQLLWPVSMRMYGLNFGIESLTNIFLEVFLFLISLTILFKTKDIFSLLKQNTSNMIISIPLFSVLLPTAISYPLYVPLVLLIPHLFYMVIFALSILRNLKSIHNKFENQFTN
jgi:membrane-bound metal-dependent hydrolase YbcI (DUF457 family)